MSFVIPQMPLPVSIWRFSTYTPTIPPIPPPDVLSIANLTAGRRVSHVESSGTEVSYLLMPYGTDIRFSEDGLGFGVGNPDLVEVPTGSGRYYVVYDVENVGMGFGNAHLQVSTYKTVPWPVPSPPTPLALDTFQDINGTTLAVHVMDIGAGWTLGGGPAATIIFGNQCVGSFGFCATTTGVSDQTTTVDFILLAAAVGNGVNVLGRYVDNNNFVEVQALGDGSLSIIKRTAGVFTFLQTVAWAADTNPHTLAMVCTGSAIQVFMDGVRLAIQLGVTDHIGATSQGFVLHTNDLMTRFQVG